MRKFVTCGIFIVIAIMVPFHTAFAHIHETAEDVTATLHIEPREQPVAGEASTIMVYLTHPATTISSDTCICTATISRDNEQVYTAAVFDAEGMPVITYTFPKTGTYTLDISGTPINDAIFEPFSFSFALHVDQTAAAYHHHTHMVWYCLVCVAIVVIAALGIRHLLFRTKKS